MKSTMRKDVEIVSDIKISKPTDDEIATLAYRIWMDRGCPVGSPDDDWFQAEAELNNHPKVAVATA
jgi:hypothetical protein